MFLKFCLLLFCVILSEAAYEGETCIKDGRAGVCRNINRCNSAKEDIRNRRNPQICSFDNSDPIVCCFDSAGGTGFQPPLATTTRRPVQSTTEYTPPVYDYENVNPQEGACEAIPPDMTSKKTGRKAFDKCIEYQEQYVYPCTRGMALTGELGRTNNCHHDADQLVIGGMDSAENEFPHMAMLGYGDESSLQWLCGGAVISDRYILTAGHCISTREFGPTSYVLVGALSRAQASDRSKRFKVKRIIKHPEYNPPFKYNDIALVELENPIKLSQYIVPACLHTGERVLDDRVLATGWGLTKYNNMSSVSNVLQKVIINKFTTPECSQKYQPARLLPQGFDERTQLCYGDKTQAKDTCQGDSGGPIQIKSKAVHCMYTIVGVTSFGRACGFVGQPGIYTRLVDYVPWIESIVWP